MSQKAESRRAARRGANRRALAMATALALSGTAWNVRADPAEVHQSGAVSAGANHFVTLEDADQLKAHYFVHAHVPVDYGEFTRYPRNPDKVTAGQDGTPQAQADNAVSLAKASADVLLDLKDISLNNFDATAQAFPMDNRLFLGPLGYYFDDSPYHYFYANPKGLNPLPCADPAVARTIDDEVKAYRHFEMKVYGRVVGANAHDKSVAIRIVKIELLDDGGRLLFDRNAGD
jgi:hypothetical protein